MLQGYWKAMYLFIVIGADFTGTLHVKTSDGSGKMYACLFTCGMGQFT